MLNTSQTLMARLMWPTGPQDKTDARAHKRVLTAARRCLHASAPVNLVGTGFQLLRQSRLLEVQHCINSLLTEIDLTCDDVLVLLPMPERTEVTERVFIATEAHMMLKIADELTQVVQRVDEGKLTSRLFNRAYLALDEAAEHALPNKLVKLTKHVDKLTEHDYETDAAGGRVTIMKLVAFLEKKYGEYR